MASWLERHLPADTRVLCSPALRCRQTAGALERSCETVEAIGPGATPQHLLDASGWPAARTPVLLVGHQPALGAAIARLLLIASGECKVRKGAVWWLRSGQQGGAVQATLVAVQSPELL